MIHGKIERWIGFNNVPLRRTGRSKRNTSNEDKIYHSRVRLRNLFACP